MLAFRFGTESPRKMTRLIAVLFVALAVPTAQAADLIGTVPAGADGDTLPFVQVRSASRSGCAASMRPSAATRSRPRPRGLSAR